MTLGWSAGGNPALRATNTQRDEVSRMFDLALDEGRFDGPAHARRLDELRAAKTRQDLVDLAADLPSKRGVRDWIDAVRPRGEDRELALKALGSALASGRISTEEHSQRMRELADVPTYRNLKRLLKGLPDWPYAETDDLLASGDDREPALAELAKAVADGRIPPAEHEQFEAEVLSATRVAELGGFVAALRARADDAERAAAANEIETAYQDGRLDLEHRDRRLEFAAEATMDSELEEVLGDLRGRTRRPSQRERQDAADRLKQALDDGRLDLAEYDERVTELYAANRLNRVEALLVDLVDPPRPARRGPLDALFDTLVMNSALLTRPRRWWMRWYPKTSWKVASLAVLGFWLWTIVGISPNASLLMVILGWPVVLGILVAVRALFRLEAKAVEAREKRLILQLQQSLLMGRKEIKSFEIELLGNVGQVTVVFKRDGRARVPEELKAEIIRVLWQSRLYPLKRIKIQTDAYKSVQFELDMKPEVRARLEHAHGPRPYGRLSADEAAALA